MRLVAAHKADTLGHLRQRLFPVVFVLDGDVAFESLALQFVEQRRNVGNAGAEGNVVCLRTLLVQVLEMRADDMAFENLITIERRQAGADPVPVSAQAPIRASRSLTTERT